MNIAKLDHTVTLYIITNIIEGMNQESTVDSLELPGLTVDLSNESRCFANLIHVRNCTTYDNIWIRCQIDGLEFQFIFFPSLME
jgi:hypothetical protein